MTDLPFGYRAGTPPAPGQYETIRVIDHVIDAHGRGTWTIQKTVAGWDGKRWQNDAQPTGWRERGTI